MTSKARAVPIGSVVLTLVTGAANAQHLDLGGPASPVSPVSPVSVGGEPTLPRTVRTRQQEPYVVLTDNLSDVVNFLPEPLRGLDADSGGGIWAVNPYASQVLRFAPGGTEPELVVPTGLNPLSVAVVEDGGSTRLLVACVGTHALFVHDGGDGRLLDVVPLDSEPGDVEVDAENGRVFVSCRGGNTVVQLDLATLAIERRYAIPCGERPGPLWLDLGSPGDPTDNVVYVAATVTGNNSVPIGRPVTSATGSIRDLDLVPGSDLPDEDVHRIDPEAGTIAPAVTRAGSLLFDVARHPNTGDLWILSSDSNNKDAAIDSEPKLRGNVVVNQLKVVAGAAGAGVVAAGPGIDLDDFDPFTSGRQYALDRSVNQARTLAFLDTPEPSGASAFVASAVSDVVLVLDAAGNRIDELRLPEHAQCYSLLVDADAGLLRALCLGTMTVEVFDFRPLAVDPIASLDLGPDPTPEQIRRGRDVFLDGRRSMDGRSGCFSCHEGGRADQLAWQLRGDPLDQKDVMVTQSLLSIGDSFPYHWRGERDLQDFAKAFGGLLGAAPEHEPTDAEMRDLVVFMQSLQAPANPLQHPRRVLDDTRNPLAPNGMRGSATRGQVHFRTISSFNGNTCSACHGVPTGSNGNSFAVSSSMAPRASQSEVAHLRQLQHKGARTVVLDFLGTPRAFNANGFGLGHAGLTASIFEFAFETPVFFALSDQERIDVLKFLEQFDQGISPACHWSVFFDEDSPADTEARIERVLLRGAEKGWNDVALFGRRDDGGGAQPTRWLFDAESGFFLPQTGAGSSLSWEQLAAEVRAGDAAYACVGLPPGNGPRFAIDFDGDGVPNGDEAGAAPGPSAPGDAVLARRSRAVPATRSALGADVTPPEIVGEPRLDFVTARLAKYLLRFSEEVTYEVVYGAPGGPQRTFSREYFARADTLVLTHAEPSSPGFAPNVFTASITLTDRAGNTAGPFPLPTFEPAQLGVRDTPFPPNTHVTALVPTQTVRVGDKLGVELRVRVASVLGAPDYFTAPGRMAFCTVAVLDPTTGRFEKSDTFVSTTPDTFDIRDLFGVDGEYTLQPGPPWLTFPLTDANGDAIVSFYQGDLSPGDVVRVSVMGLAERVPGPGPVLYDAISLYQMQQPLLEDVAVVELVF